MFHPLSFFIGLRYTRAKRRNGFISFMSFSSMIGIALGVMVLITVLSVMNGFQYEIKHRILGMARHVTISNFAGNLDNWPTIQKEVMQNSQVVAAAPFVMNQGLITNAGLVRPVMVFGVDPKQESRVSILPNRIVDGKFNRLAAGDFGIAIGQTLANELGVSLGDKVTLVTTSGTFTPAGFMPRFKRFTVVAVFDLGNGFDFNSGFAFLNLHDAQTLFEMGESVSGLRLKINDFYAAPKVASEISHQLHDQYFVSNWTKEFGAFFSAIQMEKSMIFLMLLLIIAVAAFNLVSSLVMVVNDKRADIAILRTLGATPRTVLAIFMVQGSIIGFVGTFLGLIGGLLIASNATAIVNGIQHLFHVQLIASGVYYVDYLPSRIEWSDVATICLAALGMSFLATLYPAWDASRTEPAEALRYE